MLTPTKAVFLLVGVNTQCRHIKKNTIFCIFFRLAIHSLFVLLQTLWYKFSQLRLQALLRASRRWTSRRDHHDRHFYLIDYNQFYLWSFNQRSSAVRDDDQTHYLAVCWQSQSFQCQTPNPKISWVEIPRYGWYFQIQFILRVFVFVIKDTTWSFRKVRQFCPCQSFGSSFIQSNLVAKYDRLSKAITAW